jgi:gluconolactonase
LDIIASGLGLLEGPVVRRDGSLVVTSIDQGIVYQITTAGIRTLAITGGGPNGATEGIGGEVFVAQNGGAPAPVQGVPNPDNTVRSPPGVQVIESSGRVRLFGTGMHSPSDLCFGPDGYLYVTDPTRRPERDDGRIWRCDVRSGECTQLLACDWYPNGIGFSTENDCVYVADSRHRRVVRIPLSNPSPKTVEPVIQLEHGIPDGFAFDVQGNLVIACPQYRPASGDIQVYNQGKLVEVMSPGNSWLYTNLAISEQSELFVCDAERGEALKGPWVCPGLPLHPFRASPAAVALTPSSFVQERG